MNKMSGVFISHINEEAEIVNKLKTLLKAAFGEGLEVFVSSDFDSLRGGDKWFTTILENIKAAGVVLVILSKDSLHRTWIPYEAGVGEGAGAKVIPAVHRNLAIRDLAPPLSEYHVRNLRDENGVHALLRDICKELGREPLQVDIESFISELEIIERKTPATEANLSSNLVRAWFDTVINRLLNGLRFELEFLAEYKWKWDPQWDSLSPVKDIQKHLDVEYIDYQAHDRMEQLEKLYPEIKEATNNHDCEVETLLAQCKNLYRVIRDSQDLKEAYSRVITPESLESIGTSLEKSFNTASEEDHLDVLAEYITNHADRLGPNHTTIKLWDGFKGEFLDILNRPSIRKVDEEAIATSERLIQAGNRLVLLLREVREQLSLKYGVPY